MDIGAIIKAPLDDKDWIKKCLFIGLMVLIPVAGWFNLLGWQVAYTRTRLAGGTELPEANLSYIGPGFWAFVSLLPLVGVLIVAMIVLGVVGWVLGQITPALSMLTLLVSLPLSLAVGVVAPLFLYRHIVHNDAWAGARVGWALGVLKDNVGLVLMLWVALLVAGLIAGVGGMVFVGAFITGPLGQAISGAAMADFANATNRV